MMRRLKVLSLAFLAGIQLLVVLAGSPVIAAPDEDCSSGSNSVYAPEGGNSQAASTACTAATSNMTWGNAACSTCGNGYVAAANGVCTGGIQCDNQGLNCVAHVVWACKKPEEM